MACEGETVSTPPTLNAASPFGSKITEATLVWSVDVMEFPKFDISLPESVEVDDTEILTDFPSSPEILYSATPLSLASQTIFTQVSDPSAADIVTVPVVVELGIMAPKRRPAFPGAMFKGEIIRTDASPFRLAA